MSSRNKGFTIIEMLVSLAIFAIIVTMSVGTLLVLIGGNLETQKESNTLNNLTFALDSMTREIRTGTDYFCPHNPPERTALINNQESFTEGDDCTGDIGVSFVETGSSITGSGINRIAYYFNSADNAIYRQVGDVADNAPERITPTNIHVHDAEFIVTGSKRLNSSAPGPIDFDQPMVSILIVARDAQDVGVDCSTLNEACVRIQTTVTQRILDI